MAQDLDALAEPTKRIAARFLARENSFLELSTAFDSLGSLQSFLALYSGGADARQVGVTSESAQISGILNTKSLRAIATSPLRPIGEVALVQSGLGVCCCCASNG